jgi:hypothetical protein
MSGHEFARVLNNKLSIWNSATMAREIWHECIRERSIPGGEPHIHMCSHLQQSTSDFIDQIRLLPDPEFAGHANVRLEIVAINVDEQAEPHLAQSKISGVHQMANRAPIE